MKIIDQIAVKHLRRNWFLVGLSTAMAATAGAQTNAPAADAAPPLDPGQMFEGGTNSYANWIEFTTGGVSLRGNQANFQQQQQLPVPVFGGLSGLHYGTNLDTNTIMTLDARAMAELHDYSVKLGVARENTGYLRFSYQDFRDWSDGDGGFYAPADTFFPLKNDGLGLDRRTFSLEGGYTPEKGINAIFNYTHAQRDGAESSTKWGDADIGNVTQGLSPSFYDIHESSDTFKLDLSDHVNTSDLGLGFEYQMDKIADELKITEYPGEPTQQKITDDTGTKDDVFGVHTSTASWVKTNLMVSTAFAYTHLDNTFSGSRIYGSEFDVGYVPNANYGFGYFNLGGESRLNEYVMDANLFYLPTPNFTITPSIRIQKDGADSEAAGIETLGVSTPVSFNSAGDTGDLDIRARLDLAYKGVTNWVFHARFDMTEATGDLDQYGGLIPIGGIGVPGVISEINERNFIQKYSAGARWYPSRKIIVDAGGYFKQDDYHYTDPVDSTPDNGPITYPGFLEMQKFTTYDGNVRLTLRVAPNVSLISRYDYQWSVIHTAPNSLAGLPTVESSAMQSHIIAEDASWTPWTRLNLQAGLNYVLSDTTTPASDITQAILNARNNYWTLNFSSGFVVDDKTDLNLSYVYYHAEDYSDNAPSGVPYGAGGQEHSVTLTLTRRISEKIRLSLKYGYYRYLDNATGGNGDFGASMVYATLRYRF